MDKNFSNENCYEMRKQDENVDQIKLQSFFIRLIVYSGFVPYRGLSFKRGKNEALIAIAR